MLYFSELNQIKVYTDKEKYIGVLDDLIFSVSGATYIKKILVSPESPSIFNLFNIFKTPEKIVISAEFIKKLDHRKVIIDKNFSKIEIEENELYVKKNLLDTQVIDVEDNNIVRVNDVLIQNVNSHGYSIYGVDIGISGILRWLKIERSLNKLFRIFGKYYIPESSLAWFDIQPLELTRGKVVVKNKFNNLKKLHPADLADYLETQNFKNVLALIEGMDKKYLAEVISELNPNVQIDLLKRMSIDKTALIVSAMDPDDAVDVISQFPKDTQKIIIKILPEKESHEIRRLLQFSGTPLGELLNPDLITVYPDQTVSDVIKKIKDFAYDFSFVQNIYVVNKENQLIGVFNLHELILQNLDRQVYKFMFQKVVVANLNTAVEVALRRMLKYNIMSLPVVDDRKKILGVVSVDDLAEEFLKKLS